METAIAAAVTEATAAEDAVLAPGGRSAGPRATDDGAAAVARIADTAAVAAARATGIHNLGPPELLAVARAAAHDAQLPAAPVEALLQRVRARELRRRRAVALLEAPLELPETLRDAALHGPRLPVTDDPVGRHAAAWLAELGTGSAAGRLRPDDTEQLLGLGYALLLAPARLRGAAREALRAVRGPEAAAVAEALQLPSMHAVLGLEDARDGGTLRFASRRLAAARARCDALALAAHRHGYAWELGGRPEADRLRVPPWTEAAAAKRDWVAEQAGAARRRRASAPRRRGRRVAGAVRRSAPVPQQRGAEPSVRHRGRGAGGGAAAAAPAERRRVRAIGCPNFFSLSGSPGSRSSASARPAQHAARTGRRAP